MLKQELSRGVLGVPMNLDLRILRLRGRSELDVSRQIESYGWADGTSGSDPMSGTFTARRENPLEPASLPIQPGDVLVLQYRDAMSGSKRWHEEVRFQVAAPDAEPQSYGVVNWQLASPFESFSSLEAEFVFRRDHAHRHGWMMDQIIRSACRQVNAPHGEIAAGHYVFPSPWKSHPLGDNPGTPRTDLLTFVGATVEKEMEQTKRRLAITLVNNELVVRDWGARGRAYILDLSSQNLEVTQQQNPRPPTVIIGKAKVGKGKHAKTATVTVTAPRAIDKFGYLVRHRTYARVGSHAELRDRAKRTLAYGLRVIRTATVTVPGLPGVQPFDAVILAHPKTHRRGIPEYQGGFAPSEFGGTYGVCYISAREHQIQAGIWTTQLTLQERDPWLTYRERLAEHKVGYRKRAHKNPAGT